MLPVSFSQRETWTSALTWVKASYYPSSLFFPLLPLLLLLLLALELATSSFWSSNPVSNSNSALSVRPHLVIDRFAPENRFAETLGSCRTIFPANVLVLNEDANIGIIKVHSMLHFVRFAVCYGCNIFLAFLLLSVSSLHLSIRLFLIWNWISFLVT